jgi:hypothetical protein
MGAIVTYKIFANGIELARLKNGECKQISVVAGFHRITFVVQGRTSPRFEVFLNPGDNARLMFLVSDSLLESLKGGFGLPNTYLRILWADSEEARQQTVDRPPIAWKTILIRCALWIFIPAGITLELGYVISTSDICGPAAREVGGMIGTFCGFIIGVGLIWTLFQAPSTRK